LVLVSRIDFADCIRTYLGVETIELFDDGNDRINITKLYHDSDQVIRRAGLLPKTVNPSRRVEKTVHGRFNVCAIESTVGADDYDKRNLTFIGQVRMRAWVHKL
jgi:hypothetical protein